MKQETADAILEFVRPLVPEPHIVMDYLNSLVSEDEFDPVYYWEHLSEEDKHKVCDMQNTEIALSKWEEFVEDEDNWIEGSENGLWKSVPVKDFPDWLRSK